jgi:hypothetical protein
MEPRDIVIEWANADGSEEDIYSNTIILSDGIAKNTFSIVFHVPGWSTYLWGLQVWVYGSMDGKSWAQIADVEVQYTDPIGKPVVVSNKGSFIMIRIAVGNSTYDMPAPFHVYMVATGG